jgi:deoxyadenosine/deoxycytidine kinase
MNTDSQENTPELCPIDAMSPLPPPLSLHSTNTNKIPQAYKEAAIPSNMFSIEGNIGSGKSTFLSLLKNSKKFNDIQQQLNRPIVFIPEPVEQWQTIKDTNTDETIIEKFYADQDRYAFSFQMMAYITRLSIIRKTMKENPNAVLISERCLDTDRNIFAQMLFENGKISDIEFQIYKKWFEEFKSDITQRHIYITTPTELCHSRIKQRNRKGEEIPFDYLQECDLYHQTWLNKPSVIRIDGRESFNEPAVFERMMQQLIYSINPMIPKKTIDTLWASYHSVHSVMEKTVNGC